MTIDKYALGYQQILKADIQETNKKMNDLTRLSKNILNFLTNKNNKETKTLIITNSIPTGEKL